MSITGNGRGSNSSKVRPPGVEPRDVREDSDVSRLHALDLDCACGAVENSAMKEEEGVV